ncbi:dipeptidyl-peptidase-4 [Lipingzhangella halophila]|uniref:Dipeptidyl-peptidase-4 n=1 Tax=Lipingzhangella halophila TaxID=1783352 RepID=A0A7W7RDK8_9ACTN|nr:prolyl oligopeptidase family serine peptidase [Lipingzhangella halophila]MBB4929855.1 dipeptidyl-peptidase-4 [Lipingzhangella halophila]
MSFPRQQARTRRFTLGVPRAFRISPDGRRVAFLRGRHGTDPAACLWTLDLGSEHERVVADPRSISADDEDLPAEERARRERLRESGSGIVSYTVDHSLTRASFTLSGRLYCVDLDGTDEDSAPRELPAAHPVVDPVICPLGRTVAYVSGGALHTIDVESGRDRVLAEPDGENVTWGLAEFIAAEEMSRFRGMWWAPDGSALLATRVDDSAVTRWTISDPGTPEAAPRTMAYPAAGTANADVRLAVFPVPPAGEPHDPVEPRWVEWDRATLPYLARAGWTNHGSPTIVFSAQSRDQRTLTVFRADPATGRSTELRTDTDEVWVEIMSGVPAFTARGELVWIGPDETGAARERRLFVGDREVAPRDHYIRSVVDVDGEYILYSASPDGAPATVALWLLDLKAGSSTPVGLPGMTGEGVHSGRMRGGTVVVQRRDLASTAVRTAALRDVTTAEQPPATGIASLAEKPELPAPRVRMWHAGERGIPTALVLPSWYKPSSEPLPVLVDPYGGPHAQRVLAAGSGYLTSQWFAEQGFAVLIADGRGTPGVGLRWEHAVNGDLATPVLDDQVSALHDAAERFGGLDLTRVGIRGWSFGGYLAALAVLRRPDVFHAAVAGAPVTDWRLYDTHYTERYLGLPDTGDSYERSSLLADAPELCRPLMLIHGLADDNVVFAHSQRLSTALLAAGRPHTVLPLSGITHMPSEETTAENLLLLQIEFLRDSLRRDSDVREPGHPE